MSPFRLAVMQRLAASDAGTAQLIDGLGWARYRVDSGDSDIAVELLHRVFPDESTANEGSSRLAEILDQAPDCGIVQNIMGGPGPWPGIFKLPDSEQEPGPETMVKLPPDVPVPEGDGEAAVITPEKAAPPQASVKASADPPKPGLLTIESELLTLMGKDDATGAEALKLVASMYRARRHSAGAESWAVAEEPTLLRTVPKDDRAEIAKSLLGHTVDMNAQRLKALRAQADLEVALADWRIAFEAARSWTAWSVAGMARETLEHMKRWKQLSRLAPFVLMATVTFSAVFAGWLIVAVAAKRVEPLPAALLIFVLAIFAISPAVLLLLQRPLEGVDKWRPAGGEDKSEATSPPAAATAAGDNATSADTAKPAKK